MTIKKIKLNAKVPVKTDKEKAEHIAKVTLMFSTNAAAVVAEYTKAFLISYMPQPYLFGQWHRLT